MFSTQTMNRIILFGAATFGIVACGKVTESTPTPVPVPSTTATATSRSRTIVIKENSNFNFSAHLGLALDFFNASGVSNGIDISPGRPNAPIITGDDLKTDFRGFCETQQIGEYAKALADVYRPLDTGFVGKIRLDIQSSGGAPPPESDMCHAVHTKAKGWIRKSATKIVVDSGGPRGGLEPPGTGHFDLAVNTPEVDMVLLVAGARSEASTIKITYDAIPGTAP
jgi:hypothetical protein